MKLDVSPKQRVPKKGLRVFPAYYECRKDEHQGETATEWEVKGAMTKLEEIYYCPTCGNKVKVIETGVGKLVCCGKPMILVPA